MDQFAFDTHSFPSGSFRVLSLTGEEALSVPFFFELVVLAVGLERELVEERLLGLPARLQITHHDGRRRSVVGVVRSLRLDGTDGNGDDRYRLELVPPLWYIGERFGSRIFQDLTVPQIVQAILDELHVRSELRLSSHEYRPRTYCVQYRERDVDFVTRILAEEGIFFYFHGDDAASTMVFGDAVASYRPIEGQEPTVHFDDGHMASVHELIQSFSVQREVRPGAVVLRDYDFNTPSLDLTAKASVPEPAAHDSPVTLERFEHPGGYVDPNFEATPAPGGGHARRRPADAGPRQARLRLEELRGDALRGLGAGTTRRLEPGFVFGLSRHPVERFNRKWVVTRIRHDGRAVGLESTDQHTTYQASFECVPETVPVRPKPLPKPDVRGIETARVTGSSGEEIHVDELGRIRVRFHWDRPSQRGPMQSQPVDHSTCFIRVSQSWAGTGFGVWFLPRVGMEVVVSFIGGDPDQPLVTGCVHNGEHPLPYTLPAHKTRSTIKTLSSPGGDGFNELRFEDLAKQEQIYLHAQRDLDEQVNRNHTEAVGADESISIGHDQSTDVRHDQKVHVGANQYVAVDVDRHLTVLANETTVIEGKREEKVGKDATLLVGGSRIQQIKHDDKLEVHGSRAVAITHGDSLTADHKNVDVHTNYEIDVGQMFSVRTSEGSVLKLERHEVGALAKSIGLYAQAKLNHYGKQIEASAQESISLKAPSITLTAEGSSITVSAGGIHLKSDGAITIEAPTVVVRGTSKTLVTGQTTLDLIGATVTVDGGTTNVKGAPVNINT